MKAIISAVCGGFIVGTWATGTWSDTLLPLMIIGLIALYDLIHEFPQILTDDEPNKKSAMSMPTHRAEK